MRVAVVVPLVLVVISLLPYQNITNLTLPPDPLVTHEVMMPNSFLSKTQLLMINQLQDVSTRRSLSTAYRNQQPPYRNPVRS